MDYFKHDINASEDDKICELLAIGGYELLGYYWRFVEYLYSRGGKVDKSKLKGVAWSLHMNAEKLISLINDYNLFLQDGEIIYSKRILAEVEEFEAVGKRMSEIGRSGGQASAQARAKRAVKRAVEKNEADGQACAQAEVENFQADAQQNKIKENKINKIKENKINNNTSPTPPEQKRVFGEYKNVRLTETEYQKLLNDYSNAEDAITYLDEYIEMKGYKAKSHYLAIKKWVFDALSEREKKQPQENKKSSLSSFNFDEFTERP